MEELRAAAAVLEAAVETAVGAAKRAKGQQPLEQLVTSCYFAIFAMLSTFLLVCRRISDHAQLAWCTVLLGIVAPVDELMSAMLLSWNFN